MSIALNLNGAFGVTYKVIKKISRVRHCINNRSPSTKIKCSDAPSNNHQSKDCKLAANNACNSKLLIFPVVTSSNLNGSLIKESSELNRQLSINHKFHEAILCILLTWRLAYSKLQSSKNIFPL